MIEFQHVAKRYPGDYDALKNATFRIERGELVLITGHSGAGKSTLLKIISLIERPTRGQAKVNGKNLAKLATWRVPYFRRELGIVFQNFKLLFDRSVYDNVALPLVVTGLDPREIGKRVRAALDKVGLLYKERLNPVVLSAGEQQRVGIARAIVHRPTLILADEPTGNLDRALAEEILDLFRDFHHHGATVLIATHDQHLIRRAASRVLALAHGEITHDSAALPSA
ncbi:MAG: cell division ATP-binding protein FtsE [Sulfurifustaceae bacterium]